MPLLRKVNEQPQINQYLSNGVSAPAPATAFLLRPEFIRDSIRQSAYHLFPPSK